MKRSQTRSNKTILIVGAAGSLGNSTVQTLTQETAHDVITVTRTAIADRKGYRDFDSHSPREWKELADSSNWRADVVINAAAMTDVDRCEAEREKAWRTNVDLVESILWYCRKTDAHLIHISTDYVFDGTAGPYTEEARPEPINYYGRTKLAAENLCTKAGTETTIVRTMWLYGSDRPGKPSFSSWVRTKASETREFPVVSDEKGNPTLCGDLAHGLTLLAENGGPGLIHAAGTDHVSRIEWARLILEAEGMDDVTLTPIHSADLNRKATRPLNSGLITIHPQHKGITELTGVRKGERINRVTRER